MSFPLLKACSEREREREREEETPTPTPTLPANRSFPALKSCSQNSAEISKLPKLKQIPEGKMKSRLAKKLTYEQLLEYTDDFSEENFLGPSQFGEVYRGIIKEGTLPPRHVMVKIWEDSDIYECFQGDNEARLMLETVLLRDERLKSQQGMIELYGYCWDNDESLGAVYNFNPLDTLHNLVPKDSFTWLQRIKVAIGFGRLLKFLHTGQPAFKQYLVRNIAAAHIVVDKEYNPKLFDFGMITGGILPDRTIYKNYFVYGCYGYIDICTARSGRWSDKADVFAFGVLLLNLIAKRVYTEEERSVCKPLVHKWAWSLYGKSDNNITKESVRSLVHDSLTMDSDFCPADARKITKVAMICIDPFPSQRYSMKQVMKYLLKLEIVKKHAEFLGLASELRAGVDD